MLRSCCHCGASTDKTPLPRGWKDRNGRVVCDTCMDTKYILRAATFAVERCEGLVWNEFCAAMLDGWRYSTGLANWMAGTLLRMTPLPTAASLKLPKRPMPYLYPEASRALTATWTKTNGLRCTFIAA